MIGGEGYGDGVGSDVLGSYFPFFFFSSFFCYLFSFI